MPSSRPSSHSTLVQTYSTQIPDLTRFLRRTCDAFALFTPSEWLSKIFSAKKTGYYDEAPPQKNMGGGRVLEYPNISKNLFSTALRDRTLVYTHGKRIDGYEMRAFLMTQTQKRWGLDAPLIPYSMVTPAKGDLRRKRTWDRFRAELADKSLVWLPLWRLTWWYEPFNRADREAVAVALQWGIDEGRIPAIKNGLTDTVYVSPNHPATAVFLRTHIAATGPIQGDGRHPPYIVDAAHPEQRWDLSHATEWHRRSITYPYRDRPWPAVAETASWEWEKNATVAVTHYHVDALAALMMARVQTAILPPEEKMRLDRRTCAALLRSYAQEKRTPIEGPLVQELSPKHFPVASLWRGGVYIPVARARAWVDEWIARKEYMATRVPAYGPLPDGRDARRVVAGSLPPWPALHNHL